MNHLKHKLQDDGLTAQEVEDQLSELAEQQYDEQRDQDLEDKFDREHLLNP